MLDAQKKFSPEVLELKSNEEEGDVYIVLYTNHACSGIQNALVVDACQTLQKLETQNGQYMLDNKQLPGDFPSNQQVATALPAFHVFTVCVSVNAFAIKRKLKRLRFREKSERLQKDFRCHRRHLLSQKK